MKNKSWIREINFVSIITICIGVGLGVASTYLYTVSATESRMGKIEARLEDMNHSLVDSKAARSVAIDALSSAEEALYRVKEVVSEVKNISATVKATTVLESVDERIEDLRNVAVSEARRAAFEYINEKGIVILAAVQIEQGKLRHASKGVKYAPTSGLIEFPNPENLRFLPIITDISYRDYATETHYIREIGANHFRVWRTPLDTSARNSPPISFAAVVIGIGTN